MRLAELARFVEAYSAYSGHRSEQNARSLSDSVYAVAHLFDDPSTAAGLDALDSIRSMEMDFLLPAVRRDIEEWLSHAIASKTLVLVQKALQQVPQAQTATDSDQDEIT